jgi:chemotaxis protein CheX
MAAINSTGKPEIVAPRSAWWELLRNATVEVFSIMVGVALVLPQLPDGSAIDLNPAESVVLAQVTGMVGIAGAVRAVLSLRCSERTATKIAAQMLGIPEEEADQQKADAIGEVCNMIAGHFKHIIGVSGECTLSVPTVVMGAHYAIHCLEEGERLEFPAIFEGETMSITLDIRGRKSSRA